MPSNRQCRHCGKTIPSSRRSNARYCDRRCKDNHAYSKIAKPDTFMSREGPCLVAGCPGGRHARGLCSRHRHLANRYGMTPKEMGILDAGLTCETCEKPAVVVDHDHVSGERRGFLCRGCNVALGMARDSADTLRALADYLERHAR